MLTIYNETKSVLEVTSINERISKARIGSRNRKGSNIFMDFKSVPNILEGLDHKKIDGCQTVFSGNTTVRFQRKDLKTYVGLGKSDTDDTDVLLIGLNMSGKVVYDIPMTGACVLEYLFGKNELFLVVSLKRFKSTRNGLVEGANEFKIKLASGKENKVYTYIFALSGDNKRYDLSVVEEDTEIKVVKPSYRIVKFRPNRPTHLIFHKNEDEYSFKEAYRHSERNLIMSYPDGLLDASINKAKDMRYKVCTLFVNGSELTPEYQKDYDELKKNFYVVNVLLNNGTTVTTK